MEKTCLRCQKPIALWMHRCDAYVMVIHPTLWRDSRRNSNPLDRLTVADTPAKYPRRPGMPKKRPL